MHDSKQIELYRRMTPDERVQVWKELTNAMMRLWEENLDEAEIERRMAIWRREHDLSDENMLRAMREAR